MYNIYFNNEKPFIYIRTMQYMLTVNDEGKSLVEFYDPEKFIPAEDYFKKATYIGKFAKRTQPISIAQWPDISYMTEDQFVLLYKTENLGIGYDVETKTYEIIPKEYMDSHWSYMNECKNVEVNEFDVVKNLLMQSVQQNAIIKHEVSKLEKTKSK